MQCSRNARTCRTLARPEKSARLRGSRRCPRRRPHKATPAGQRIAAAVLSIVCTFPAIQSLQGGSIARGANCTSPAAALRCCGCRRSLAAHLQVCQAAVWAPGAWHHGFDRPPSLAGRGCRGCRSRTNLQQLAGGLNVCQCPAASTRLPHAAASSPCMAIVTLVGGIAFAGQCPAPNTVRGQPGGPGA